MISFNRFTIKTQEIVKNAFDFVRDLAHQQIEPEHFLLAVLSTPDNVGLILLKKIIGSPDPFQQSMIKMEKLYFKMSEFYRNNRFLKLYNFNICIYLLCEQRN